MELRCSRIFSDHMVLQRNLPVSVFGYAPDGKTVTVSLAGDTASAVAQGGKWLVKLPARDVRGAQTMTVACGGESLSFADVVYGEVWIAGGQSNMEFPLERAKGGMDAIRHADDPDFRYYHPVKTAVSRDRAAIDAQTPKEWLPFTPENAHSFSAVASFFAKRLRQSLQVPVGIIECNWGGTSASCWMSEGTLSSDPALQVYFEEYRQAIAGRTEEEYQRAIAEDKRLIEECNMQIAARGIPMDDAEVYYEKTKDIPFPWPPPQGEECYLRPCGVYHTMLRHVAPYTARGVVWYQGESDVLHAPLYARLMRRMIENWRLDFQNDNLTFAMVQLPSFVDADPDGQGWGLLRQQQMLLAETVPDTLLAVAYDTGERENIHPVDKQPVSARLADQVLAHVYLHDLDVRLGHVVKKEIADGAITLQVDVPVHCKAETVMGFALCGADGVFHHADAVVHGSTITVSNADIPQPKAVRYAMTNWTDGNVVQKNGIPLPPFEA